jgi:hypothetical protein
MGKLSIIRTYAEEEIAKHRRSGSEFIILRMHTYDDRKLTILRTKITPPWKQTTTTIYFYFTTLIQLPMTGLKIEFLNNFFDRVS